MEIEIWEDIIDYEGLYQVSNLGNIKMLGNGLSFNKQFKKERLLIPSISGRRYYDIRLSKNGNRKSYKLHRLVAKQFIPNPLNKPQVNHINGIKTDNRAENLEWCTCKENQIHAHKIGLHHNHKGDNSSHKKINFDIAKDIRYKYFNLNITIKFLANEYKLHKCTIARIINNKLWK